MTPVDYTLKMLDHYHKEIAEGRTDPNIILVHATGAANWAGLTRQRKRELLLAELKRMDAFEQ